MIKRRRSGFNIVLLRQKVIDDMLEGKGCTSEPVLRISSLVARSQATFSLFAKLRSLKSFMSSWCTFILKRWSLMSRSRVISLISLKTWHIGVENKLTVGAWLNLLITDEQSVPIDTLNLDKLCFKAVHSKKINIERNPQSSAPYG